MRNGFLSLFIADQSLQFSGRKIACSQFIPFANVNPDERVCAATGGEPGADFIDGDRYLALNYQYYKSHLWR